MEEKSTRGTYRSLIEIGQLAIWSITTAGLDKEGKNPLLKRWVLWRIPAIGNYIHKFFRSDYDRALHDHPWAFITIILKGGYYEVHDQTRDGSQETLWHGVGSVLVRPAQWRHRVVLPEYLGEDGQMHYRPSWSFVIVFRREQNWGFFLPTGWCWWRKHDAHNNICEDKILHMGGKD